MTAPRPTPWLFSRTTDLAVFGGSAALAMLALALGDQRGWLHGDTPEGMWIAVVLLVDVAHVHTTWFRVYLEPVERRRRPWAYAAVPALAWALGLGLFALGEGVFWRVLAYLAVWHFVRQQFGWVMLYRARCDERDRVGRWVDGAAIYLATLWPMVWWHVHPPRDHGWLVDGDMLRLPGWCERPVAWAHHVALGVYFARSLWRIVREGRCNPGKDLVVATTALCWWAGIVWLDSDYAFTVTNVLIHGIPYAALVYVDGRRRAGAVRGEGPSVFRFGPAGLVLAAWAFAFVEELLWDRGFWHERSWLFGGAWSVGGVRWWLLPLLAVPQATHYVLDAMVWKRGDLAKSVLSPRTEA